jgi:hypothetical protein
LHQLTCEFSRFHSQISQVFPKPLHLTLNLEGQEPQTITLPFHSSVTIQDLQGQVRLAFTPARLSGFDLYFREVILQPYSSITTHGFSDGDIVNVVRKKETLSIIPSASGSPKTTIDEKTKAVLLASFAEYSNSSHVEIVFSFDTTGSMNACLNAVRKDVESIVRRLMKDIGKQPLPSFFVFFLLILFLVLSTSWFLISSSFLLILGDIRIGIITHGDYCDGDKVINVMDLNNDVGKICKFIQTAPGTGGGDLPEAYELVLREANKVSRSFSLRPFS